jgi:hypothetical protein
LKQKQTEIIECDVKTEFLVTMVQTTVKIFLSQKFKTIEVNKSSSTSEARELRARLKNKEDVQEWFDEFQQETQCSFIVERKNEDVERYIYILTY